ncbi:MAG: PAS domain S-box protein [Magnetococcales bacterium]|nr:PAS domain S-box protein [Magnetococcales bacterium]
MMHRGTGRHFPTWLLFGIAILLFLAINGALVIFDYEKQITDNYSAHVNDEIKLIILSIKDPLIRNDLASVESILQEWLRQQSNLLVLKATMANGFKLVDFSRNQLDMQDLSSHDIHSHALSFQGQHYLDLLIHYDLYALESAAWSLSIKILQLSTALLILFALTMRWVIKRTMVDPLEREIKAHYRTRAVLEETLTLLQESQNHFQTVLDHAKNAIYLKDGKFRYLMVNRMFQNLVHQPLEKIIGRTDFDLFPAQIASLFRKSDLKAQEMGHIDVEEKLTVDGMERAFISQKFKVMDGSRDVLGVGGISTDITEQVQIHDSLCASQNSLANAQRIAHLGNWDWDISRDTLVWSDEVFRIFGQEKSSFLVSSDGFFEAIHPQDRETVRSVIEKALLQEERAFRIDHRIVRPYGEERDVRLIGELVRSDDGSPTALSGTIQDITEQKQTEEILSTLLERLSEKEKHLRLVLKNALDAIITMDDKGDIVALNPAAEQLFGYSRDELLGKNVIDIIVPEEERPRLRKRIRAYRVLKDRLETSKRMNMEGVRSDGGLIDLEMAIVPVPMDHSIFYTGFIRDVTDRKQLFQSLNDTLEVAESANRMKSEFLANMSHEIRSPMNAIMGMTDLVLTTEMSAEEARKYLSIVQRSSESLLEIINSILDLSKLEAGQCTVEEVTFDLCDLVEEVCELLAVRAHDKRIELYHLFSDDLPDLVVGDQMKVRQVLTNLISNAIKFTSVGEVVISLHRLEPTPELSGELQIGMMVTDTGIGIPPEKIDDIFSQFTQADSSTTRKFGGTGLGLTICQRLVQVMGGKIWAESVPEKGSKFHVHQGFSMPYSSSIEANEHVLHKELGSSTRQEYPLDGCSIAIIDEHKSGRRSITALLERNGANVIGLSSVHATASLLESVGVDVYLVDYQTLQNLVKHSDSLAHPPPSLVDRIMIFVPSVIEAGQQTVHRWMQTCSHVKKPVKRKILLNNILHIVGNKSPAVHDGTTRRDQEPDAFQPLSVLLVEDLQNNRILARTILEKAGHIVMMAENGREAIDCLKRFHCDLVLTDIQMPEMDGIEMTRVIRNTPAHAGLDPEIPIIAVTARTMSGDREKMLNSGMTNYLGKPFSPKDLLDLVTSFPKRAPLCVRQPPSTIQSHPIEIAMVGETFMNEWQDRSKMIRRGVEEQNLSALSQDLGWLKKKMQHLGLRKLSIQIIKCRSMAESDDWDSVEQMVDALLIEIEDSIKQQ